MEELTREKCLELLKTKYEETSKKNRYPKKDDFSPREAMAIKAFLGPWPRALELAGIKPLSENTSGHKTKERRILSKRKINLQRKESKKNEKEKIQ